jgi:hypothetical protein
MAEPSDPTPENFPNSLGTVHWHFRQRKGQPTVWLAQGTLDRAQTPTWGLVVAGEKPQLWRRPREVTEDSLREWLESVTDPEIARVLAASSARTHPDLFTEAP